MAEPARLFEDDMTIVDDTRDYDLVRNTITYLTRYRAEQPGLHELAENVGLSPAHFQKLFRRWAGLTPKEFQQSLNIDYARKMLRGSASILDASYETGLSGPGRLHDLFVQYEAMTPGDYKRRGEGLHIDYGFHHCPFGLVLLMVTSRGLAGLAFADGHEQKAEALADMKRRWPKAIYHADETKTAPYVARIFNPARWRADQPLQLVLIGTDFEIDVWQSLLKIPVGQAVTYGDIAREVCSEKAARAVGSAVGRNPISFVVPCHRAMRKGGGLGGYHWGLTRKQAIIGWEAGLIVGSD